VDTETLKSGFLLAFTATFFPHSIRSGY